MNLNTTQINTTPRARYGLAKAWMRFFARLIDFAICFSIVFVMSYFIITTDPNVGFTPSLNVEQTWRYFLITLVSFTIMFLYFVIQPLIWKGRTFGKWIFKLTVWNLIPTKSFSIALIKREFFLWMLLSLVNLVLGILLSTMSQSEATELLRELIGNTETTYKNTAIVFQTCYLICGLILFGIVFYMFLKNKKRCLQDVISNTAVVHLVDISSDKDNKSLNKINTGVKTSYRLPGEVSKEALDDLDSF